MNWLRYLVPWHLSTDFGAMVAASGYSWCLTVGTGVQPSQAHRLVARLLTACGAWHREIQGATALYNAIGWSLDFVTLRIST